MGLGINKKLAGILCGLTAAFAVQAAQPLNQEDPYETYNRSAYRFNQAVDKVLLKPVAEAYNTVAPAPVKKGVGNFFSNLNEVPTTLNDILQANFYQAGSSTCRFILNSTLGVVGFFDVATGLGVPKHQTDFGITLAKWGFRQSSYLVLPLLGPGTVRDTLAWPVNYSTSVVTYVEPDKLRYGLTGLNIINKRAQLLKYGSSLSAIAFDPYVFERNAYLQQRDAQIRFALNPAADSPEVEGFY